MTVAPGEFLNHWFSIMDSDRASDVLDLISDDFQLSIVFSTQGHADDFSGDRAALVVYLEQRERGTRTHHRLAGSVVGADELFLGEVRRSGVFEASFVAAGRIGPSGKLSALLIGRSPGVRFTAPPDEEPHAEPDGEPATSAAREMGIADHNANTGRN